MGKTPKELNSSDDQSDGNFSEEEKLLRKRDARNKDDPKNKLRLGEFHRNNISKKQKRKPSLKKKLRDAKRLMER